jgi:hypothetical protein
MHVLSESQFVQDPVQVAITRLSDDEIRGMARDELLDVIRLSEGTGVIDEVPDSLIACETSMLLDIALACRDRCTLPDLRSGGSEAAGDSSMNAYSNSAIPS